MRSTGSTSRSETIKLRNHRNRHKMQSCELKTNAASQKETTAHHLTSSSWPKSWHRSVYCGDSSPMVTALDTTIATRNPETAAQWAAEAELYRTRGCNLCMHVMRRERGVREAKRGRQMKCGSGAMARRPQWLSRSSAGLSPSPRRYLSTGFHGCNFCDTTPEYLPAIRLVYGGIRPVLTGYPRRYRWKRDMEKHPDQ